MLVVYFGDVCNIHISIYISVISNINLRMLMFVFKFQMCTSQIERRIIYNRLYKIIVLLFGSSIYIINTWCVYTKFGGLFLGPGLNLKRFFWQRDGPLHSTEIPYFEMDRNYKTG